MFRLNDNYELTCEDVQDLSSRDALYEAAGWSEPFIDSLVRDSKRHTRELGERLKDRICFEIFPHFARGFILYAQRTGQLPAGLSALPAGERNRLLEPFFSGTLTFLYRLLFLFYAESRDLLPVREVRGYYQKSLEKLKRQELAFIDYKSLGVRQLGSIYESLLEFKLRIAPVEMAVVKGKKTEEVIPYTEALQKKLTILREGRGKDARDKTLPEGTVYLENDRREPTATGSYYTPGYIVKYIVEHTVSPILHEKLEALRPVFRAAGETLRAEQAKVRALSRDDIHPEQETYKKFREELNGAFFDLKVLDPAMGSGHFLVEAVEYITDQMASFLASFKWNPVIY